MELYELRDLRPGDLIQKDALSMANDMKTFPFLGVVLEVESDVKWITVQWHFGQNIWTRRHYPEAFVEDCFTLVQKAQPQR